MDSDGKGKGIADKVLQIIFWFSLGVLFMIVIGTDQINKIELQSQQKQELIQNLLDQNRRLRDQLERDLEIIMDTEEKREMIRQKFIKGLERYGR